jgi:redox-sensing transcriptional repressor
MIPKATIERLCVIHNLLEQIMLNGDNGVCISHVSSTRIGEIIGVPSHTVRKDINFLEGIGQLGKGYSVKELRALIAEKLGLKKRKAAVIGLGKVGTAIMEYEKFLSADIEIVAGFDSTNKIDTTKSAIPLFPSLEISEIVKQKGIEIAFLTSSPESAKTCFERLEAGGVKSILNFTPTFLTSEKIHIRNIDLVLESTILSAMMGLDELELSNKQQ